MSKVAMNKKSKYNYDFPMFSNLKGLISHATEWHLIPSIGVKYMDWLYKVPAVKTLEITPYDYCIAHMDSNNISIKEAECLLSYCLIVNGKVDDIKNIEAHLIKTFNLIISKDTIVNTLRLYKYYAHGSDIIKYIYTYGYIPSWDELVANIDNSYNSTNMLRLIAHVTISNDFTWVDQIVANDDNINAETIITKIFFENTSSSLYDNRWPNKWSNETSLKFYAYLLEIFYKPPVDVITLIKMVNSGISYRCLRNLVKKSNLIDTDFYELFDYMQCREYCDNDGDIVSDFPEYIQKNEKIVSTVVEWLCKQTSVIKYIRSIHKKTKCEFTQAHLEAAAQNVKSNFALIRFLLENSDRKNIKITKKLFEKVMEQQKPPRIFCLLLDYLE